jgi:hypothetical protein
MSNGWGFLPVRVINSQGLSTRLLAASGLSTFAPFQSNRQASRTPGHGRARGDRLFFKRMNKSVKASATASARGPVPSHPIDLLHRLARAKLPIRVYDFGEIEILRVLKLGGTIKAAIPEMPSLPGCLGAAQRQLPATVAEITSIGRFLLERFAPGTRPQCL